MYNIRYTYQYHITVRCHSINKFWFFQNFVDPARIFTGTPTLNSQMFWVPMCDSILSRVVCFSWGFSRIRTSHPADTKAHVCSEIQTALWKNDVICFNYVLKGANRSANGKKALTRRRRLTHEKTRQRGTHSHMPGKMKTITDFDRLQTDDTTSTFKCI